MVFKINISEKSGKTYKLESEAEFLIDKELHDKFDGKELSADLEGYELEITGTSDKSGFTAMKEVAGVGRKRILLSYGKGMKRRPKHEGKNKRATPRPKGLRLRKTVRGRTISPDLVQINMKVSKEGKTPLAKIYGPKEEAPVEEKKE